MKKLILILLTVFFSGCMSYKDIVYKSFEGVNIEKVENGFVEIGISVKVFNPNNYTIKIKEADLKANFNGKDLGDITLMNTLSLDANKESTQKVICKVSSSKLMAMLPMALMTGNSKLTLDGDLKAKVFLFTKRFPVNVNENINLGDFSF